MVRPYDNNTIINEKAMYYIKVNEKVARHLHLEGVRYRLADGNYLLWQDDMRAFGLLSDMRRNIAAIGGVLLTPAEARQEQRGERVRELPAATDERFVVEDMREEERPEAGDDTGADATPDIPADGPDDNAETDETTEAVEGSEQ